MQYTLPELTVKFQGKEFKYDNILSLSNRSVITFEAGEYMVETVEIIITRRVNPEELTNEK